MFIVLSIYKAEKLSACLSTFFLCNAAILTTKAHIDAIL